MNVSYIIRELKLKDAPASVVETINSFFRTENLYKAATRVVEARLQNLNDDFRANSEYNPIQQIQTRIKSPRSIMNKLERRGFEVSIQSARENLTDIAGVRVTCSYIEDIYLVADLISSQKDIQVIRVSDYIKEPKPNGYRSYHLIIAVPVFLSKGTEIVNVEIQLRTMAMDFWASLEHHLFYKYNDKKDQAVAKELFECAEIIANTDMRMQRLFNLVESS